MEIKLEFLGEVASILLYPCYFDMEKVIASYKRDGGHIESELKQNQYTNTHKSMHHGYLMALVVIQSFAWS